MGREIPVPVPVWSQIVKIHAWCVYRLIVGIITSQGGYETLCGGAARLKHLQVAGLRHIDVMCTDAGSGYKPTEFVCGLRNVGGAKVKQCDQVYRRRVPAMP